MLNSVGGLTRKRYLRRVELLVNIVLMSYGLYILWILWHRADLLGWVSSIAFYLPIQVPWSRCYSLPCSCSKVYKGDKCRPLKIRLEEHRKAVVRGEIEKSGMANHIWKEKENPLLWWDIVKIIDREEHWRIRRLKKSADMLVYSDLLSRSNIEMKTIWEPIIKKVR